jgi:hypothetical protein
MNKSKVSEGIWFGIFTICLFITIMLVSSKGSNKADKILFGVSTLIALYRFYIRRAMRINNLDRK